MCKFFHNSNYLIAQNHNINLTWCWNFAHFEKTFGRIMGEYFQVTTWLYSIPDPELYDSLQSYRQEQTEFVGMFDYRIFLHLKGTTTTILLKYRAYYFKHAHIKVFNNNLEETYTALKVVANKDWLFLLANVVISKSCILWYLGNNFPNNLVYINTTTSTNTTIISIL